MHHINAQLTCFFNQQQYQMVKNNVKGISTTTTINNKESVDKFQFLLIFSFVLYKRKMKKEIMEFLRKRGDEFREKGANIKGVTNLKRFLDSPAFV